MAEAIFEPTSSYSDISQKLFDIPEQTISYKVTNYKIQSLGRFYSRNLSATQNTAQAPHIDLEISPPEIPANTVPSNREFTVRDIGKVETEVPPKEEIFRTYLGVTMTKEHSIEFLKDMPKAKDSVLNLHPALLNNKNREYSNLSLTNGRLSGWRQ